MSDADSGSSVDRRQLLLVSVAVVGLLLAALFAPAVASDSRESSPRDGPQGDGDGGDGQSIVDILRQLLDGGDGEGDPPENPPDVPNLPRGDGGNDIVFNGSGDGEVNVGDRTVSGSCAAKLSQKPKPGREVTVTVYDTDGPAEDAEVRFNGDLVGLTDSAGRVSGRVPYEDELSIGVTFADGEGCDLQRPTAGRSSLGVPASGSDLSAMPAPRTGSLLADDGSNVSVPVNGTVEVRVAGDVIPGERVEVLAAVDGEPMREADVYVDGEWVGVTDLDGEYRLTVPDDGRGQMNVTVARGDFSGSKQVPISLLELSVEPRGFLSLPGGAATVVVTRGGERLEDVPVTVDGERIGRTDENGELSLTLPESGTLTVSTPAQEVSTTMADVFGTTELLMGLYTLVGLALSALVGRRRGRVFGLAAAYAGGAALGVFVVVALAGWLPGSAAAVAAVVPLGVLVVRAGEGPPVERSKSLLAHLLAVPSQLPTHVIRAARSLGELLDGLWARTGAVTGWFRAQSRALLAWARSQPRSVRALFGRFGAWLGSLPRRARATVTSERVAAAPVVVTVVLDGYAVGGYLGAVGGGFVAATGVFLARRSTDPLGRTDTTTEEAGEGETPAPAETTTATAEATAETLTERWRRFARWVRPGDWRTSSAREIERTATERGYPDDAAAELTNAFRHAEYSERSVSERARNRARAAYERLQRHRRDGGDGT